MTANFGSELLAAALVGGLAGGTLALVGTLRSDREPDTARWVTIPVIPAILVVGGAWTLIDRVRR